MKKRMLSLGVSMAMLVGITVSGISTRAATLPDFSDNFERTTVGSQYVGNCASISGGKLVLDSKDVGGLSGVVLTAQKFQDFVLQFDVNAHAYANGQMFTLATGLADADAPSPADRQASSLQFGNIDSTLISLTGVNSQSRYSWGSIPYDTDITLRLSVTAGVFNLSFKRATDTDYTAITGAGTLSTADGYIALMYEGEVKAVIDNLTVTTAGEAAVTAKPNSGVTVVATAETITLPDYPQGVTPTDLVKDLAIEGATSIAVTKADGTAIANTDKIENGMKLLVKRGDVTKRIYTIALTAMPASPTANFTDNFDRAELGDNYTVSCSAGSIGIQDGKLTFNKPNDVGGVYMKTPQVRNFTMSFDFKPEEGSSYLAIMTGLTAPGNPGNYITPYTTRISLGTELYNVSDYHLGEGQLNYVAGSGLDTDANTANGNSWWRTGNLGINLEDNEYLNVRMVFENGSLRMYYKLNTDPDWMLYIEHSTWKGVQSNGYISFMAQGNLNCAFSIDNLSITSNIPAPLSLNDKSGNVTMSNAAITLANGAVNVAYSADVQTVKQLKALVACEDTTVVRSC